MSDPPSTESAARRRWINLGEGVAVVGLVISGLALWNSWGRDDPRTAVVVAPPRTIPLALRGKVEDDGKRLTIAPVEASHALEALTLAANGKTLDLGSDPVLAADAVEPLVADGKKEGAGAIPVMLDARYIEAGAERQRKASYRLTYRWVGGGFLSGHSLRLTGLTRA